MFRPLTDTLLVSPQISLADIEEAKAQGVTFILNNRPDDEEPGQLNGPEVEAAAKAAGIGYAAVPVSHGGFAPWQIDGMDAALAAAQGGKLLAYCRSGTRSTLLWRSPALARAKTATLSPLRPPLRAMTSAPYARSWTPWPRPDRPSRAGCPAPGRPPVALEPPCPGPQCVTTHRIRR